MKKILIYGPGCAKCNSLAALTKEAMQELNLNIPLEKVTDAMQFTMAGVLLTPALAIDDKIILSGKVPSKDVIKSILQNALAEGEAPKGGTCCGSSCCSPAPQPATLVESPCGCGSSCSPTENKGGWKKAVVWVSILLILLAIVKIINRPEEGSNKKITSTATVNNGIELVYYEYGARCTACIRMEKWTEEIVKKDFPSALQDGRLSFQSLPADEAIVRKYKLTTKSLILKQMKADKETKWSNLDEIWRFSSDEVAFKAYIADHVRQQLQAVK